MTGDCYDPWGVVGPFPLYGSPYAMVDANGRPIFFAEINLDALAEAVPSSNTGTRRTGSDKGYSAGLSR